MAISYTNSYQVKVRLEPWFSLGYNFTSLRISESLGGILPKGAIKMKIPPSGKAYKSLLSENFGTLYIENDASEPQKTINYKIPIFITGRSYDPDRGLGMDFVCVSSGLFLTQYKYSTFSEGIDKAIKTLYPGNVDIRGISSDVRTKKFIQSYETDYEVLNRLCNGYKYESVFGYSWSGLIIKDLIGIGSQGNDEREHPVIIYGNAGQESIERSGYIDKSYDFNLSNLPINIWEASDDDGGEEFYRKHLPVNCRVIQKGSALGITGKDNIDLYSNGIYNTQLLSSGLYSSTSITMHDIPQYRLGDIIEFRNGTEINSQEFRDPNKYFLDVSNELFIAVEGDMIGRDKDGYNFSFTSGLRGLLDDGVNTIGTDTDRVQEEERDNQ